MYVGGEGGEGERASGPPIYHLLSEVKQPECRAVEEIIACLPTFSERTETTVGTDLRPII